MIKTKFDTSLRRPGKDGGCDDDPPARKVVVVLGMHRSGTSAITRGLCALGVNLGDNLLPPIAGCNDKGFFEDFEIFRLNEELLEVMGTNCKALPLILPAEFKHEHIEKFKSRAVALLRSKLDSSGGTFGFKDPRTARLMPFWREVFDHVQADIHYLLAVRHPTSVAKSLQKFGMAPEKSNYLWLDHVTASVLSTEQKNRLVVDYDVLLDDPESQLKRMAESFNLAFDPASALVREYTGEFLEKRLRHTRYHLEDPPIDLLPHKDVIEIHRLMMQMAHDRLSIDATQVRRAFLEVRERLLAMNPIFQRIEWLDQCTPCRKEQIVSSNSVLLEHEKEINKLGQAMKSVEQRQKSWFKRLFHPWYSPGSKKAQGVLRRLER